MKSGCLGEQSFRSKIWSIFIELLFTYYELDFMWDKPRAGRSTPSLMIQQNLSWFLIGSSSITIFNKELWAELSKFAHLFEGIADVPVCFYTHNHWSPKLAVSRSKRKQVFLRLFMYLDWFVDLNIKYDKAAIEKFAACVKWRLERNNSFPFSFQTKPKFTYS